jgi:hypothetical protein
MKKIFILIAAIAVLLPAQATAQKTYNLNFNAANYTTESDTINGKTVTYRAYRNLVYVSHPVDAKYQCMNIFIPEEYFQGKSINGYTAETAPIFMPNGVGGYMPALPGDIKQQPFTMSAGTPPDMQMPNGQAPQGAGRQVPDSIRKKFPMGMRGQGPDNNTANRLGRSPGNNTANGFGQRPVRMQMQMPQRASTELAALAQGYVVAYPGIRGRTLKDSEGINYGKAPALIVDYKAAVRYLRFNDKVMPGDAEKIISNGTSAGGALSSLLSATGNSKDYEPYLKKLGAADEPDNIFAASCYCPITNLDNADAAYEWQFNSTTTYGGRFGGADTKLTAKQIEISNQLKPLFITYVNSLQLKAMCDSNFTHDSHSSTKNCSANTFLTLDKTGNGSFKNYVMSFVTASAQEALDKGTDLSGIKWLTIKKDSDGTHKNGKIAGANFEKYVQTIKRMKTPPAFDALDLSSAETNEFGTVAIDAQHFTQYSADHSSGSKADAKIIRMMNPMAYIADGTSTPAKHWRIRHGTIDRDGSIATPIILATKLQNNGYDVDLALPWNTPHSGDYDLPELFKWIDSICK